MRTLLWAIVGWLVVGSAAADALVLQPYIATYHVTYRGLNAGELRMQLTYDPATNRYTFETRAKPSVLARLVIGRDAIERTVVEVTPDGIRPLEWFLEDGKSGDGGDGQLTFDWSRNVVSGTYEGHAVELPAQPGLQDRLSIQLAVNAALAQGREPNTIVMVNGDRTREYTYISKGTAEIDTKLGKLSTIIYESTRPGSDRVSKVWHVPSLEYLPARVEQIRKGKVETVMVLQAIDR
ncbi:MAG TPA: DUF3108 domain-containing protein [Steroidobacteraceae bacterium]